MFNEGDNFDCNVWKKYRLGSGGNTSFRCYTEAGPTARRKKNKINKRNEMNYVRKIGSQIVVISQPEEKFGYLIEKRNLRDRKLFKKMLNGM